MIDLFIARPRITLPPSMVHFIDGEWAKEQTLRKQSKKDRAVSVRAYYLAHLKEIKAYQADYREQNREAIRKRQREWVRQKRADAKKAKA